MLTLTKRAILSEIIYIPYVCTFWLDDVHSGSTRLLSINRFVAFLNVNIHICLSSFSVAPGLCVNVFFVFFLALL